MHSVAALLYHFFFKKKKKKTCVASIKKKKISRNTFLYLWKVKTSCNQSIQEYELICQKEEDMHTSQSCLSGFNFFQESPLYKHSVKSIPFCQGQGDLGDFILSFCLCLATTPQ